MEQRNKLRNKIVSSVIANFGEKYRVIDNRKSPQRAFNGTFPDVILMQQIPPENDNILFIMKIEDDLDSDLLDVAPVWKLMSESLGYLYIIVDKNREQSARKIISAIGIRAKLAVFDPEINGKISIRYD